MAAKAIVGEKSVVDYTCIPAVLFSEPEIAVVGLTEESVKEKRIQVNSKRFPFIVNGRAIILNQTEGFVKLITRQDNGVVIGGQIIGLSASDLITEISLAVESGLTAEGVALTIHAYPILGKPPMETVEVELGTPIHVVK